jgi:broad specificity polyphosphatase/5'/3'-nucleotidase SurE
MAQTFDGAQFPDAVRFTLSGTPDLATQVVIPSTASKVSVRYDTNDGKLAFEGTDAAAINANYALIDSDYWAELSLSDGINESKGVGSIFVASGTASTVCTVMIEG